MPDTQPAQVSILIPTHNRPDYLEIALNSALAQSYENIEIVVSDNSDDDATGIRIGPYLEKHPNIRYSRSHGTTAQVNFARCLEMASGEFINFLMDDDVFHPEKIRRMMECFQLRPEIGLVTSSRQLIDQHGNPLPPVPGTEALFQQDTVIGGKSFGDFMLGNGQNLVGEPTTVLFRRAEIAKGFGFFLGREYRVLSDLATWLSILADKDCIYLPEALSYFRLHPEQDQRGNKIKIQAQIEWMQLICAAHQHGAFLRDKEMLREKLAAKLPAFISYLGTVHAEIRTGDFDIAGIQECIQQATNILLID